MNTSAEAIRLLQEALTTTQAAARVLDDLIVEHQYQDVSISIYYLYHTYLQSIYKNQNRRQCCPASG